ncbi:hypothetical protein [Neobacillus mesonae]|uniref:hypothetical protein n=1 Tax=Neobacillus mesonae TaxID=1193713 RepID=UPI002E205052|nr:hypothetical protein [Neobacillus mesonae]
MATYRQIQEYIKEKHGYSAKTCWIAHMKEVCGLNPRISPNRHSPTSRVHPCPEARQQDIKQAFQYFNMFK